MKMFWLGCILLMSGYYTGTTQAQQIREVHGRVLSADSLLPVAHVHLISKTARRGTISNRQGVFFHIVVTATIPFCLLQ